MLLGPITAAAARDPGHPAFTEGQRQLGYAEALQRAQAIAQCLSGARIAVALPRGIDAALAILACLYAGAAYVPLDTGNPPTRLRQIVSDADVQLVLGHGACPGWLPWPERWLDIGAIPTPSPAAAQPTTPWATPLARAPRRDELAAILYTSGSTGTPKGVALSHRAMANFVAWALQTFGLGAADRIASIAPFHFDLSVFDLFAGLAAGASIHFVPNGLAMAPSKLSSWLAGQAISTFYTVPSLLAFLAVKGNLAGTPLPNLKRILFAGEVFPTPQLIQLCNLLPGVALYNLYGPTETNVCAYWPVDRQRLRAEQPIPIGIPACHAQLRIDPDNGELLVDSANNLTGYWRGGRLEAQAGRWYRTGDRVSLNAHGELLYHGRLDRMLKCSGYRVEPAEIEAALHGLPGVVACAVFGIDDPASGQRPAAGLVLQPGYSAAAVAQALRPLLPAYMLPCKYLQLDALPRLANGKVDYASLLTAAD